MGAADDDTQQFAYAASGAWHQLEADTSEIRSFDEAPAILHIVVWNATD